MEDQQTAGRPSLPEAWRAAVRFCPFCSGLGVDAAAPCVRCGGTGDLMEHLLQEAYREGRGDALVIMRDTYRVARLAGEQVRDAPVPGLKVRLGLGGQ